MTSALRSSLFSKMLSYSFRLLKRQESSTKASGFEIGLWWSFLGTGPVSSLLGCGGLAYTNHLISRTPYLKQLCVIRAAVLTGILGLLEYCIAKRLEPNRPANRYPPPLNYQYAEEGVGEGISLVSNQGKSFPFGLQHGSDLSSDSRIAH